MESAGSPAAGRLRVGVPRGGAGAVAGRSDAAGARVTGTRHRPSDPVAGGARPTKVDRAMSGPIGPADSRDGGRLRVLQLLRQSPEGIGVTDLAARSGLH